MTTRIVSVFLALYLFSALGEFACAQTKFLESGQKGVSLSVYF